MGKPFNGCFFRRPHARRRPVRPRENMRQGRPKSKRNATPAEKTQQGLIFPRQQADNPSRR